MAMQRLVIYPYDADFAPVVRYAGLMRPDYEVAHLVSPRSWGHVGTVVYPEGEQENALTVDATFDKAAGGGYTLFVPNFEALYEGERAVLNRIIENLPAFVGVICEKRWRKENQQVLASACLDRKIPLQMTRRPDPAWLNEMIFEDSHLEEIDVPIIAVAGLWEGTDKFEVSMGIAQRLRADGYHVTQIGARDYIDMLGEHTLPAFLFRKDLDGEGKILRMNRFLQKLAREEQPDVILLTLPGAMQSLNMHFTGGFGVIPYLLGQAAVIDYLVVCSIFEPDYHEALEAIGQACLYRLGCGVNFYHMSNLLIDFQGTMQRRVLEASRVERPLARQIIAQRYGEDMDIPVEDCTGEKGLERLYQDVIRHLSV